MSIEIQSVGPVKSVSIPVPEEGGVVVLRGRNGSGKSYTLGAVDRLVTGKGDLRPTDGKAKGSVEFGDAKLTVGRSVRRSGELEVVTLDGRLSIADLVDPGIISPEAADAKRIKALVTLVGRQADPSLFYDLFGGKEAFDLAISDATIKSDDLVMMVARVKQSCEKAARHHEETASKLETEGVAVRKMAEGFDASDMPDPATLQAALESAAQAVAKLKAQRASEHEFDQRQKEAIVTLDRLSKEVPMREAAERTHGDAKDALDAKITETQRCREALARCEAAERDATEAWRLAAQALEAANRDSKLVAELQEVVTQHYAGRTTLEDVEAAEREFEAARITIEGAAVQRDRQQKAEEADRIFARVKECRRSAEFWRQVAKDSEGILSSAVQEAATSLRVDDGRLVTDTSSRGETFYHELSHGERWKIALDIAIAAVGQGGLITVPQEAWEGLDPENRKLIDDHVRGTGVVILTAEADDESLRAEVFGHEATPASSEA